MLELMAGFALINQAYRSIPYEGTSMDVYQRLTGWITIILSLGAFVLFLTHPNTMTQPPLKSMIEGSLAIALLLLGSSQLFRSHHPRVAIWLVLGGCIFAIVALLRFV